MDQVAALARPVLWIGGGEDAFDAGEARAATLHALLPDWQLRVVPNAGHSVYFERAGTFNALVSEFLAAVA